MYTDAFIPAHLCDYSHCLPQTLRTDTYQYHLVDFLALAWLWQPERVGLGIKHIVVQTNKLRPREDEVEILECLGDPKALLTLARLSTKQPPK